MPAPPAPSQKQNADAAEKPPVVSLEHTFPGITVDVENKISGPGAFAVYPVTEKKNRLRPCYIVMRDFIFELHKSAKDVEMCRPGWFLVDLRLVFNICIVKEMASVKDECICIMTPAETYYIELDPKHFKLHVFFKMLIERCKEARSFILAREVSLDEYFEVSWDVICLKRPKVKRAEILNEVENPDVLIKNPQLAGRFRLVPKPGIIFLYKMNIPVKELVDGSYPRNTYYELSLNSVATWGRSEKYFFIQIGRYSEFGHGELWMECESSMSTKYIHERIDAILQSQSERRRGTGTNQSYTTIGQHALKSRMHRQRSSKHDDSSYSESRNKDYSELEESSKNKTNSTNDIDRQQQPEKRKGVMGAIRKAFKGDETSKEKGKFGGLFGKKKKDEPCITRVCESSLQITRVTKVYGDTQEDYMEYYHNDDIVPKDDKSSPVKSIHSPREHCPSTENPRASHSVLPVKTNPALEYFYPFAETDKDSSVTVRLEKKPKKSLSIGIDDGMLSSKNEPRTYSLGSKPTQLNRRVIPKTSSGTYLRQPQADSATGSMNTVESIVEEGHLSMSDSDDEIVDQLHNYESEESDDEGKNVNKDGKQLNTSDAFTPPLLTVEDKPCSSNDQLHQKPPTPIHLSDQDLNTTSKTPEKESEVSITDMIDLNDGALRIRAHSLGSKTLITSANLRKIAGKQGRQPTREEIEQELLKLEMPSHRERTGSSASSDSKNMYSTRYRSKFGTKKSAGDLMELEFSERRHTESLDSSANRSRNSSLGFKSPGIKTALDKVLVNKNNNSDYDECQPSKQANAEGLNSTADLETENSPDNNLEEKTNQVTDLEAKVQPVVEDTDPDEYEQAIIALTKKAEDEKLRQSQLDADYVMMGTSPETQRKFPDIVKDLKDSIHQKPSNVAISPETRRRHRDQCKKKDVKTPMRDLSVNSNSSEEHALANYDSDDSIGRLDRSGEMIITKNDPVIYDSIIHQATMRPISRSMNANSHYLSYRHPSKAEETKDLSEREIKRKEDTLLAEWAALQKIRMEDHSPSRNHSNVIPPFHRHYSVGQQSARLLRSPSPKSIGGRTAPCTTPGCTLCQDGTGRPRTSFIDSAALLASPMSSRKHSTIVQSLSRSRVNSTASRKKTSAPRKQSSTGQFPTYGHAEEETSNVIKRDRQYSHSVSPKTLDYKPVRKMGMVPTRKSPMNFNMIPLNIKQLTESENTERQRVDSVTSRKSAHCRRHRRSSFKQDRHYQSAKEPRTRSYPAPIFGHVDYAEVELIDPSPEEKYNKKKKCKRKERSPSERPYRMY